MDDMVYYAKAAAYLAAALAIGIGVFGPAIAQGKVGASACENMGKYPESADMIRSSMITSTVLIETCAIYALIVAVGILALSR